MAEEVVFNNQCSKTLKSEEELPVPCFYNWMKKLIVKKKSEKVSVKLFSKTCWFYCLNFMLLLSTMHGIITLFI